MLDQLGTQARSKVAPLLRRWETFTTKVWERFTAIAAEAEPGIDHIVAMDPHNTQAISTAFSAVESRVRGLSSKVQDAEATISRDWDESTDDLDLSASERPVMRRLQAQIVNGSRQLQRHIDWQGELLAIKKYADWARVLRTLAESECARGRQCANCGGPIEMPFVHQACSVTCGHCGAVSSVTPGTATGMFFQGPGVHSLAREAARDAWLNEKQAEAWFHGLRHPTEDDRNRYLDAARQHWVAYYRAFGAIHPGLAMTPEQAAEDKLRHVTAHDKQGELRLMRAFGELVRRAKARDASGVVQLCREAGIDVDDAVSAVHERGDREGTMMMLDIQYRLDRVDEPKAVWTSERCAELDERLASR